MRKGLAILLLCFIASGCEKALMKANPAADPEACFQDMWNILDEGYAYFALKGVDWNEVYARYKPQVYEGMADEELFEVLSAMLYELRDGHVNLRSNFDVSRNWQWYLDYPENFDYSLLERHYLKEDYYITGGLVNKVIDSVGYIYYSSFSRNVSDADIDFVLNRFEGLKGVIIDIRGNGGGNTLNSGRIASRFTDIKRHAFDDFYKNGPGHEDFYEKPVSTFIAPQGAKQFTGPVVLLTNRSCYSAATQFIQTMRVLPYVTIMGDSSGGGGGFPVSYELLNGWVLRYSSSRTMSPEGYDIEQGIPPDVPVSLDPDSAAKGIDTMIERAMEEIGARS